jgi:hypothetical protein
MVHRVVADPGADGQAPGPPCTRIGDRVAVSACVKKSHPRGWIRRCLGMRMRLSELGRAVGGTDATVERQVSATQGVDSHRDSPLWEKDHTAATDQRDSLAVVR